MRTLLITEHLPSLRALLPEAEFLGADDIRPLRCTSTRAACGRAIFSPRCRAGRYRWTRFHRRRRPPQAAAVLCEPPPRTSACLAASCRTSIMPTAAFAKPWPETPSRQLKLIGVTGTNGKTTTSCLIASVLLAGDFRAGVAGTLGYFDGQEIEPATHTTPTC